MKKWGIGAGMCASIWMGAALAQTSNIASRVIMRAEVPATDRVSPMITTAGAIPTTRRNATKQLDGTGRFGMGEDALVVTESADSLVGLRTKSADVLANWIATVALGTRAAIASAPAGDQIAETSARDSSVNVSLAKTISKHWAVGAEVRDQHWDGVFGGPSDLRGAQVKGSGLSVGTYVEREIPLVSGITPVSAVMQAGVNIDYTKREFIAYGGRTTSETDYINPWVAMGFDAGSGAATVFGEIEVDFGGAHNFDMGEGMKGRIATGTRAAMGVRLRI